MKKLKLDHNTAISIDEGGLRTTWRLYDDKDLSVNDTIELIDKVDPQNPEHWVVFGTAQITSIIEKRLGEAIGQSTPDDQDRADLFKKFQQYYGPNVTNDTVVKIVSFNFVPKKSSKESYQNQKVQQHTLKIYADGGSRGNPGPSASGFVVMDTSDRVLVDKGVYLGVTTNNQAEYRALQFALQEVQQMGVRHVDVYMDSLLVINQMKGIFKVKNRDLWPIHDAIKQLVTTFDQVTFTHVPRELNKLADAAVNRTLDEALTGVSKQMIK